MKIFLGIMVGSAIGFLVSYFGKCSSGVCPLTRSPIISTIIGAALGAMITMGK